MNIKPFKAIYPKLELIASPDSFFGTVKYQYKEYYQSGFFKNDGRPSYFIYDIVSATKSHRGLLACVSIEDYNKGNIIKHEETLPSKEQKTIHLMIQREAMVKPALLTYRSHPQLNKLIEDKVKEEGAFMQIKFADNGSTHTFTQIDDENSLSKITNIFKEEIGKSYIADGHHRFSAASILDKSDGNFDFSSVLVALFPFEELDILDFNRTVQILHEISPTMVMAKLSQVFNISILEMARKPLDKHELILYMNHEWYGLNWKPRVLEKYSEDPIVLDTLLFNELILKEQFAIHDFESDIRIGYVTGKNGIKTIKKNVEKNEYRIGFMMYPISIEEMIKISDENLTLPAKSTWFEPRIINGLISKSL